MQRIISAAAMILLAYLALFVAPQPYGLFITLLVIASIISIEMDIMRNDSFHILYLIGLPLLALIWDVEIAFKVFVLTLIVASLAAGFIAKFSNIKLGWLLAQCVFLYFPIAVIYKAYANNVADIISVVAVIITMDIFAFIFGKLLGKKLIEKQFSKHSHNKTWEGYIGGIIACIIVGNFVLGSEFSSPTLMAIFIAVCSQAGDIFASYMKRSFGVKDSGNIIPGHGGVLDRFDGFLGAYMAIGILYLVIGVML